MAMRTTSAAAMTMLDIIIGNILQHPAAEEQQTTSLLLSASLLSGSIANDDPTTLYDKYTINGRMTALSSFYLQHLAVEEQQLSLLLSSSLVRGTLKAVDVHRYNNEASNSGSILETDGSPRNCSVIWKSELHSATLSNGVNCANDLTTLLFGFQAPYKYFSTGRLALPSLPLQHLAIEEQQLWLLLSPSLMRGTLK
jgi:hypothetical protein